MNRVSTKRKATTKLRYNSTFSVKEFRELVKKPVDAGKERQKAKAKADKWHSEWIRLRDAGPDGYLQCITCPRRIHWRDADAGHFLTRAKEATRYHEHNSSGQCKGCNRFQGGKFYEHEQAIERKFGPGTVAHLKQLAGQKCKRTTSDYLFIANSRKAQVDRIKELEPGKYRRNQ